jgi:hypothetical protein
MKALVAALALVALVIFAAPAEARGRSVSRQVVRGHGHARAQVVCAAPVYAAPLVAAPVQAQFLYPAPQQVFLPQVSAVYAPAPQVVLPPQPQVVLPQAVASYPQQQVVAAQIGGGVFNGRQVSKSKQVVRGNAAAQAVILPY